MAISAAECASFAITTPDFLYKSLGIEINLLLRQEVYFYIYFFIISSAVSIPSTAADIIPPA